MPAASPPGHKDATSLTGNKNNPKAIPEEDLKKSDEAAAAGHVI